MRVGLLHTDMPANQTVFQHIYIHQIAATISLNFLAGIQRKRLSKFTISLSANMYQRMRQGRDQKDKLKERERAREGRSGSFHLFTVFV